MIRRGIQSPCSVVLQENSESSRRVPELSIMWSNHVCTPIKQAPSTADAMQQCIQIYGRSPSPANWTHRFPAEVRGIAFASAKCSWYMHWMGLLLSDQIDCNVIIRQRCAMMNEFRHSGNQGCETKGFRSRSFGSWRSTRFSVEGKEPPDVSDMNRSVNCRVSNWSGLMLLLLTGRMILPYTVNLTMNETNVQVDDG